MSALELNSTCQADAEIQAVTTDAAKREVLLSRARRYTASWNHAEDIVQSAFTNCLMRRNAVPASIGELTTCVHNAAVDQVRRDKHHRRCVPLAEDSDEQISVRQLREMEIQAAREEVALIWETASDEERELLQLKLDGLKGTDIAVKLGVPLGTYSSRWFRLCARIRDEFADRLGHDA